MSEGPSAKVERARVSTFVVPTEQPESDGTYAWQRTTLVAVELASQGEIGLGYTYANAATAVLVRDALAGLVVGHEAFDVRARHIAMATAVRNLGHRGIAAMAISAVDVALWDLKAKLLGVPLIALLGRVRAAISAYGSGGFTSYSNEMLGRQLGDWARSGMRFVKMKVGSNPNDDVERVRVARAAIGADAQLFVDANGAYDAKQALALADRFAGFGVTWFEEPVSSDDLAALRLVRMRAPAGMHVAAGEYGYDSRYFVRLLRAQAVDVAQADVTRCGGVSGFLDIAALCDAHGIDLSCHCAPALHVALACACSRVRHIEYFFDHARIEQTLLDGAHEPEAGWLRPDPQRPGLGLALRARESERFRTQRACLPKDW